MKGHLFSHEWLTYIGGSTKTDSANTVGKYGEGFKICCLSLLKLGIPDVVMHSGSWYIKPTAYPIQIEDKTVEMLGYLYWEGENDGETRLTVRHIPEDYERFLKEGPLHFFYEGNPLLGEELPRGVTRAFRTSSVPIPCEDAYTSDFQGILYYHNLARARLPFPFHLVYLEEMHYGDSRSRDLIEGYTLMELLYCAFKKLSPEASLAILEYKRSSWSDLPNKNQHINWYYHICQLVRNAEKSEECKKAFQSRHPSLWYLERFSPSSPSQKVLDEAKEWAKASLPVRLVNPVFRKLGASSVLSAFQKAEENPLRPPEKGREEERIKILQAAVEILFPIPIPSYPPILLTKEGESWVREQHLKKTFQKEERKKGRKYQITQVALSPEDLGENTFFPALLKLSQNLFLVYGKEKSATFSGLLTDLGSWVCLRHKELKCLEDKWREQ
ncbi:MAG: hypothetical protein IIZ39_01220, partial [Blautia sp.]|nr:hypothetical protein [Blautia sp.]